ncbi:MAG: hypothetical protein KDC98_10840, partial [Planctomycetes bacterium]|nr:hypothetical protein [Planctomycetota bacterium]
MHRAIVVITALLFAAAAGRAQSTGKPPRGRELDKLVERILAADDTDDAAHREREAMLAEVRSVAPLAPRDVDKWKQKIAKLWRKGRTLEKSGDNLFFADGRGRYIVGGETRKPTGLLIAMHGGGQGSGDAGPAAAAYGPAASRFGWVMIAPEVLERTECGWTDAGTEEFVLGLVDAALRTWKVDADQVYFAGHSMGGYGSWTLGGHHADRVAAIAPSAGAPTPIRERSGGPVRERTGGPIVDIIEGVIPS